MNLSQKLHRLSVSFAAVAALAACSGGGGSDSPAAPTPPAPPAPSGGITLTGVVARGAALANASVAVTCSTGAGTVNTTVAGAYGVTITGGALPCVLRATSSDGSLRLHSVAPASTSTNVTANVTPLTELVVARLTGSEPATYVGSVNAGTLAGTATAAAVAAAQASVASTLAAGGVNTSTAGDFIAGPLVAAGPGTPGNAYDLVLDALSARLATVGTTLARLTTAIAANSTTAGSGIPADTASLPPDLLLKPKAANCASAASGSYRLIKLAPSPGSTVTAVDTVDFDAPTLTLRLPGTGTVVDTWQANGNCRYASNSGADIVVSPAGVLVARATIGTDDDSVAASARGTVRAIIGLPVQAVAVSELAGTWNSIGWARNTPNTAFGESGFTATVAGSGAVTSERCTSLLTADSACANVSTLLPVISTNAGGLNVTSTDPSSPFVERGFAYRAGNGDLMLVSLSGDGSFSIFTKQRTLSLPAVGEVTTAWNLDVGTGGLATTPLYYRTNTVVSVNTAAASLVRNTANDASTVTAPQTLQFNQARNGYIYRPGATVTASDGSTRAVRELFSLRLSGFGLTPYYLPATTGTGASPAVYGLSLTRQP